MYEDFFFVGWIHFLSLSTFQSILFYRLSTQRVRRLGAANIEMQSMYADAILQQDIKTGIQHIKKKRKRNYLDIWGLKLLIKQCGSPLAQS